jgi:hypothetical protein
MRSRVFALILTTVVLSPLQAQIVSLDEGSFTLIRAGERVGREDYSIRSAPAAGGGVLVAQGNCVTGTRRVAPGLNADSSGFPLRYQSETRVDGRVVESYSGQTTRSHYASRAQSERGESAREFRLPPGTVAADDEVAHQLWFIVRRGPGAVVPVLVPQRSVVETVRVELVGTERLTLETRDLETRHLRLRTDGTGVVRDVWIDASGHLIKVEIPALKLVAVRDL